MKITIIGAGNMGGAMACGLADSQEHEVTVTNISYGKLEKLKEKCPRLNISYNNAEAIKGADLVVIAVKPWCVQGAVDTFSKSLDYEHQMVASVVGGMGTEEISTLFTRSDGKLPAVFYIIPNTAIAVKESMTFITSVRTTKEQEDAVKNVFDELGMAMYVEERFMNAGLAVASCGIAYAMRYIRAAMEGGIELGLYASDAQKVVTQTLRGAAMLLQKNGSHPEVEIDRVTTPAGLTIRGLAAMEEAGFSASVIRGLRASMPKEKQ